MSESSKITIAEIQVTVKNIEKEIAEIKNTIKTDYQTKDAYARNRECIGELEERIEKIEANLSKVVWMVLSAVISAILYVIMKN